MPTTGEVRIVTLPGDFGRWDDLLDLVLRSFAYMDGIIDPPSSALRLTPEALEAKAQEETVLIACAGDRLAGCIFLADRCDHLYLGKLAVDPAFQRKGVGRLLVEAAEKLARASGKRMIELQTRVELTANQAAFAKLGFREAARTAHPGFDRPTSVTMRRDLA